jgi:hypothetical protein
MTHEVRFDKIENAIRDLIVVSRSVVSAVDQLREVQAEDHKLVMKEIRELRDAQLTTEEKLQAVEDKLHALIDTVDRIIRGRNL